MASAEASVAQAIELAAVKYLRAALERAGRASVSIVVDPTLADPLPKLDVVERLLESGLVTRHVLPHIHDNIPRSASPYVLHVPHEPAGERCVNDSIAIAVAESLGTRGADHRGRSVCAWLVGEPDPDALAARLATAARVRRPDGAGWALRFWDPRVIWHLPRILSPQQYQHLCAVLGEWHAFDPLNALVQVGSGQATVPSAVASMSFDTPTWAGLTRIGMVNTMLPLALDWGILPTVANAARIDAMIQRCNALGFDAEQDVLAFCACALTSRDDVDAHPAVQQALHAAARSKSTVMQALQPFDDDFWRSLRAGTTDQGHTP